MQCQRLFLAVVFLQPSFALGDDWPQWRGPHRDGISQETGLLKEWPQQGPRLVWQQKDIGDGYSTPAVVGPTLYLLSNRGIEDEFVQALKTEDGSQLWSTRIGKVGHPDQRPPYPGARSTPTIDGQMLYALGSDGDLSCLETATGRSVWTKNIRTEFGGEYGEWAYSESPLVDGNAVVCTPGGSDATLVALNKKNGELIWKCPIPGGEQAGYASIIVIEALGVKQYVQFLAKGLVGVDASSGKLLWRYDRTAQGSPANIPTPVAHGPFIYSAAGRSGAGLVELKRQDDGIDAAQVYFTPKLPTGIGGSIEIGDWLYGTTSRQLVCANFKTGDIKWEDKCIGASSLCWAEGLLYLHGENDDVALVEATPDAYRQRGRFTLPDQPDRGRSKAWAYPVIANGRLYLRDLGSLWCYDIKSP